MELAAAMAALPGDDALALFLADAGASESLIAERLEIDPESVGPLLEVARRKLDALVGRHVTDPAVITCPVTASAVTASPVTASRAMRGQFTEGGA